MTAVVPVFSSGCVPTHRVTMELQCVALPMSLCAYAPVCLCACVPDLPAWCSLFVFCSLGASLHLSPALLAGVLLRTSPKWTDFSMVSVNPGLGSLGPDARGIVVVVCEEDLAVLAAVRVGQCLDAPRVQP